MLSLDHVYLDEHSLLVVFLCLGNALNFVAEVWRWISQHHISVFVKLTWAGMICLVEFRFALFSKIASLFFLPDLQIWMMEFISATEMEGMAE